MSESNGNPGYQMQVEICSASLSNGVATRYVDYIHLAYVKMVSQVYGTLISECSSSSFG